MKLITHAIYISTIVGLCFAILVFISIWHQTVTELHRLNDTATAQLEHVVKVKHHEHIGEVSDAAH